MNKTLLVGLLLLLGLPCDDGYAAAYKCRDAAGKLSYSDLPCPEGVKDEQKIKTAPAMAGHGAPCKGRDCDYDNRSTRSLETDARRATIIREQEARKKAQTEATKKQREALVKECERNRGTNCNDSSTLRYMQEQNIPRRRY